MTLGWISAVTLTLGTYHIRTTGVIARDGVGFIHYAQGLQTDAIQTLLTQDQHPGYPWLIAVAHRWCKRFSLADGVEGWVVCAQGVSLLFRWFTLLALFLLARSWIGAGPAGWAVLLWMVLPKPAHFGADALSDWPSLFFLTLGWLLLWHGLRNHWIGWFAGAGLSAGLGYLIRPECAQVVVVGGLWLLGALVKPGPQRKRSALLGALAFLVVGFLLTAGPYMKLKGAIFPKKHLGTFAQVALIDEQSRQPLVTPFTTGGGGTLPKALDRLVERCGDMVMWLPLPFLVMGLISLRRKPIGAEAVVVGMSVILNAGLLLWLYCHYGYLDDRHVMPLLLLPLLLVPDQVRHTAPVLKRWLARGRGSDFCWFLGLMLLILVLCVPKLLRSPHDDKRGYRTVAVWLRQHTSAQTMIDAPDNRISFYAQRQPWQAGMTDAEVVEVRISKGTMPSAPPITAGRCLYQYQDDRVTLQCYAKGVP